MTRYKLVTAVDRKDPLVFPEADTELVVNRRAIQNSYIVMVGSLSALPRKLSGAKERLIFGPRQFQILRRSAGMNLSLSPVLSSPLSLSPFLSTPAGPIVLSPEFPFVDPYAYIISSRPSYTVEPLSRYVNGLRCVSRIGSFDSISSLVYVFTGF